MTAQHVLLLQVLDFPVGDLDALGVVAGIELGADGQPGAGGGRGDGVHDDLVAGQRPPAPVHRDVGEQPVLDFVPLGCARRQVADGDLQASFCGKGGQLGLPQPGPVPVGPAAVGGDQQPPRAGVGRLAGLVPPGGDRGHREGGGVVVGAHAHPAGVAGHVVHPVGGHLAQLLVDEVMDVHRLGGALGLPFGAALLERPDIFLLLGVHADHRVPGVHVVPGLGVNVTELRITVGVPGPLQRLDVALQAEALLFQQRRHRRRRHRVPGRGQRRGQVAGRLGRPPQRRLRVSARLGVHQRQQRGLQPRVGVGDPLAAAAGTARAPQRLTAALKLGHAPRHSHRADVRRGCHHLDPAVAQNPRLRAHHQPPLPLVQVWEQRGELGRQRLLGIHGHRHTISMTGRGSKVNVILLQTLS